MSVAGGFSLKPLYFIYHFQIWKLLQLDTYSVCTVHNFEFRENTASVKSHYIAHTNISTTKIATDITMLGCVLTYLCFFQVREKVIQQAAVHVDIVHTTVNVSLRITYEFNTLTADELAELVNFEMNLETLGNFSVSILPELIIFESTSMYTNI